MCLAAELSGLYDIGMETRRVLEGVPKIAFAPIHDGKFEFTPFPSALKAVLKYLGSDFIYPYLLATSGGAFRLVWHSERWEGGSVDIVFMDENPVKPFQRALESTGFGYEILLPGRFSGHFEPSTLPQRNAFLADLYEENEEVYHRKIIESIDGGKPLIALGVVGPPEACIITGYDEGGDVLLGWSMFQEHLDPSHDITPDDDDSMNPPAGIEASGYFRQTDWFRQLYGLIVLKGNVEVDRADVYRETLAWVPGIVKTPRVHEYYTGLRAYDAYIEKMREDSAFPAGDMATLSERKMVHYDAMTMIAERGGGAEFLKEVAEHPGFEKCRNELLKAAKAFSVSAAQMEAWWKIVGPIWDDEEAQIKATADREVRRKFIPTIEKSRDKDRQAAEHIENALEALNS
jgi:hypothetical protein